MLKSSDADGFGGQEWPHSAARDRQECLPHRGSQQSNMKHEEPSGIGACELRIADRRVPNRWPSAARRHGTPFTTEELLGEATFTASKPSTLVDVPLPISLPPGEYGLVFGSGMFGAGAHGAMVFESGLPGVSYLDWYDSTGGNQPF